MMGDQMYMRCGVWCWRRAWVPFEIGRLQLLWEAGRSDAEIGKRLRRSAFSIQRKRLTLDLRRNRGSQPWPPERLVRAQRLRASGLSSSAIARELGHKVTRNMVIGALWRAGQ
jgi:hypothetical protein